MPLSSPERCRCEHCGEIIGVYEPMVVIVDGEALQCSRAAPHDGTSPAGPRYHGGCFAQLDALREESGR